VTAAKLQLVPSGIKAPSLPKRTVAHPDTGETIQVQWHPRSLEFWTDTWASPMAHEFLEADTHGLFILVTLVDAYWKRMDAGQVTGANELAKEIRLQRQCFGLTPMDRRRLQWEIEKVEEKKNERRRPAPKRKRQSKADPRQGLAAVK
jgi:hypothetical protein